MPFDSKPKKTRNSQLFDTNDFSLLTWNNLISQKITFWLKEEEEEEEEGEGEEEEEEEVGRELALLFRKGRCIWQNRPSDR